jgi:hypothetical protein
MKKNVKKASDAPIDPSFAKVMDEFGADRAVSTGKKFGTTSLRRDGRVFVMLMPARFVARLPRERVDELVAAGVGTNLVMGKRVMKEWLAVDRERPGERRRWLGLAREAYAALGDPGAPPERRRSR